MCHLGEENSIAVVSAVENGDSLKQFAAELNLPTYWPWFQLQEEETERMFLLFGVKSAASSVAKRQFDAIEFREKRDHL